MGLLRFTRIRPLILPLSRSRGAVYIHSIDGSSIDTTTKVKRDPLRCARNRIGLSDARMRRSREFDMTDLPVETGVND